MCIESKRKRKSVGGSIGRFLSLQIVSYSCIVIRKLDANWGKKQCGKLRWGREGRNRSEAPNFTKGEESGPEVYRI